MLKFFDYYFCSSQTICENGKILHHVKIPTIWYLQLAVHVHVPMTMIYMYEYNIIIIVVWYSTHVTRSVASHLVLTLLILVTCCYKDFFVCIHIHIAVVQ